MNLKPTGHFMGVQFSPSITAFDVQRCIRIQLPNGEQYLPIDPRQNGEILANISKTNYIPDPTISLILIQDEGVEYAAMDGIGGAFGGVYWRVIGLVEGASQSPLQVHTCLDEPAAREMCATFQGMLDAFKKAQAEIADKHGRDVPLQTQRTLIALKRLHPEFEFSLCPIGKFGYYAELDAPDVLVTFGCWDRALRYGSVDPYATYGGIPCDPSHWGLSEAAALILQRHNLIFRAKYPNADGPKAQFVVEPWRPMTEDGFLVGPQYD